MRELTTKPTIQDLAYYAVSVEPKSFADVLGAKSSPSFRMIKAEHGQDQLTAILGVELTKICQLLAFKVSGEMIAECAANIADEYWYCKLDDIKLFKTYLFRNRLPVEMYRNDALVLYRLFEEYELLRHREVSNESEKRRKTEMEAEIVPLTGKEIPMPDWYKESVERITAKMKVDNVLKSESPETLKSIEKKKEDFATTIEGEKWQTCPHEFTDKGDYSECKKCNSIIYK